MNIGHLNKSIISYRNMIDSGLILVPEYLSERKRTNGNTCKEYE